MQLPLRRRQHGFTVIELLVVIVVVCILVMVVALAYSGVQANNRNKEREDDINLLKSQLEEYYAQSNAYPTLANLNDAKWRAQNLKHIAQGNLQDPRWSKKTKTCAADNTPLAAAMPTANCYSYQVTAADGTACDNDKTTCAHYTLTAILEGGEKYVKSSLN